MRVFAVYNIKGGVGKTTTAVNLAYLSSLAGARTLLWDLDPQAAATFYFRIKPKVRGGARRLIRGERPLDAAVRSTDYAGLDLLPADFSYRHLDVELDGARKSSRRLARLIGPLADAYDHVYLDCAPSISTVSESVFAATDALLVPTIPTTLSLRTLDQLRRHLARGATAAPRVLPFFCMVDRRKAMHRQICREQRDAATGFLRAEIPYSSRVERMGERRAPLLAYAPTSAPAQAYEALWREILDRRESWLAQVMDRLRGPQES